MKNIAIVSQRIYEKEACTKNILPLRTKGLHSTSPANQPHPPPYLKISSLTQETADAHKAKEMERTYVK